MNSTPEISTAFDGSAVNRLASADGLAATAIPFSSMDPQVSPLLEAANRVAMRAAGGMAIGLARLLGSRSRGRMGILTYHRVTAPVPGLPPPTINVAPSRFREQVTGLLRRGFTIWPLRELLRYNAQAKLTPPRTIALTFDDGFQSVYTEVWPVLREFRVPATVFLATAYLDSPAPFPFDSWGLAHRDALLPTAYRPMTTQQCRELAADGLIDLGAHTHTHCNYRGSPASFRKDLQISADCLHALGSEEVLFSFPFGIAGPELVAAAKLTGVKCGLTTDCALIESGSDPFEWGRINAFSWDTAATLTAKLDGWYTWAACIKRFVTGRPLIRAASNHHANPVA